MYQLVVKGSRFQAARAAADRNVPFVFDRENGSETLGRSNASIESLTRWLCEEPREAPYPAGALLWYN